MGGILLEKEIIWQDKKRILGMPITFTRYKLYRDRLVSSVGLFSHTENEILLYRITDMELRLSLLDRILGVGTITLYSVDTNSPRYPIEKVKNPRKVKSLLDGLIWAERERLNIPGREMIGASTGNLFQNA